MAHIFLNICTFFVSLTRKLYFVKNLGSSCSCRIVQKVHRKTKLEIHEYSLHSRFDLTSRRCKRWLDTQRFAFFIRASRFSSFRILRPYRGVSFSFWSLPGRVNAIDPRKTTTVVAIAIAAAIFRFSFLQCATGIPKFTGEQGREARKASSTINNVRLVNEINYGCIVSH